VVGGVVGSGKVGGSVIIGVADCSVEVGCGVAISVEVVGSVGSVVGSGFVVVVCWVISCVNVFKFVMSVSRIIKSPSKDVIVVVMLSCSCNKQERRKLIPFCQSAHNV